MIKTIGELKKAINNIDDDFTIDVRIVRELSEEELSDSNYPYPYEYTKANLEIGDIDYSDKDVFINVEEISNECEWRKFKGNNCLFETSCGNVSGMNRGFNFCPYCGKKIKVNEVNE